jgi:hypothetical protein
VVSDWFAVVLMQSSVPRRKKSSWHRSR